MNTKSPYENYTKPAWYKLYAVEILIFISGIISVSLIFFAKAYRETNTVNPETAAQLGDFVGGFIGTIFALISILLLYSTLKNQRETSTIEKFETKYFELVRLHRDNVAELSIGKDTGRKIFVLMIRELRSILDVVKLIAGQQNQKLTSKQLLTISYYILFFGVGPNSSRMLKVSLKDFEGSFINKLDEELNNKDTKNKAKAEKKFHFTPFEGHQSRLGHYYRHLYQTVCYVDNQALGIDKYDYVKTIRAQLTTHEQALLLINSLTPIGSNWWHKDLIIRYRLVQNIPCEFFEKTSELDVEELFPKDYFEWQENKEMAKHTKAP